VSLTSFRVTLGSVLSDAFGVDHVSGRVEGPVDRALLCTWPASIRENSDDVNLQDVEVNVRMLLQFRQQHAPESPVDPADLEEAAEQLQQVLADVQTEAGPWFFRPVDIELDVDARQVTARCVGTQFNGFPQT